MNIRKFFLILITIGCLVISGLQADVPHLINYQGTLTDTSGNPITGTRQIGFFLFADSVGGYPLWMEDQGLVEISDGLFRVTLGSETSLPDSLFNGSVLWLAIRVSPDPAPFAQRQPLNTVLYSFRSLETDHASHSDTANYALSGLGLTLPYAGSDSLDCAAFFIGNLGIGTVGSFKSSNTSATSDALIGKTLGSGRAIFGETRNSSHYCNYGYLAGEYGAYGEHYNSGNHGFLGGSQYGLYGFHDNSGNYGYIGGDARAVYGKHASSNAYGFLGGNGTGAYGANLSVNTAGFLGGAQYGVSGYVTNSNHIAVHGSHQLGNYGDLGSSQYGVYGYGNGIDRIGVYGSYYMGSNYGYLGSQHYGAYAHVSSTQEDDCAVRAENVGGGFGVYATTNITEGTAAAVYAEAAHGGYALRTNGQAFLQGHVWVADTLSVAHVIKGASGLITIPNTTVIEGDLFVTGAMVTSFPRPAWNSGWFRLGTGDNITLTHNLGGDHRDYFVDLQLMEDSNETLNNFAIGEDFYYGLPPLSLPTQRGAFYDDLGPASITVCKGSNANTCDSLRVRIWVVPSE
jgi:hypothetical protein